MAAVVVLAVVVVVLGVLVLAYNGLVRRRDQVDDAWGQVDVELRRRSDLIPTLVETVNGYAAHERGAVEAVAEARARALRAHGPADQGPAESALTGALKGLFAVVESYSNLRASRSFLELRRELSVTEDRAAYARQYYNAIATVPQRIVAAVFRFRARAYFQPGGEERGPVPV